MATTKRSTRPANKTVDGKSKLTKDEARVFFGCRVTQRTASGVVRFFVFYAPVKDVNRWAGVRRVTDATRGTQRLLRETRVRAITRFLQAAPDNSIPNNILVSFDKGKAKFRSLHKEIEQALPPGVKASNNCNDRLEWGQVSFSFTPNLEEHKRPIQIVDGQHRVHGMASLPEEDLPALVVGLLDASLQEQAFQFIVINSKATRVPTDNVKSIIEGVNEDELRERLLASGVPYGENSPALRDVDTFPSSPFRELLDWPFNRKGQRLVPLTAIEQSLRYVKSSLSFIADDEDSVIQIFISMWSAVKGAYPELWGRDNALMKKVNINAMNEFMTDRIKAAWEFDRVDLFDDMSVKHETANLLNVIPARFWEQRWTLSIQDNAHVRSLIKSDFETMLVNGRLKKSWSSDLRILSVGV